MYKTLKEEYGLKTVIEWLCSHAREKNHNADLSYADLRCADLSGADLSYANLSYANLIGADLRCADLSYADLSGANLSCADLRRADLRGADLSYADLSGANLSYADLSYANLIGADLRRADLRGADLSYADLSYANLRRADLSYANLSCANLRCSDLSGAKGIISPIDFMKNNFETTSEGYIVYKKIGDTTYEISSNWKIDSNSILEEVCNPLPTVSCGCGINFGTLEWCRNNYKNSTLWKCLIRWEWLPGVVIPYSTDGKARCLKLQLLEIVKIEND